MSSFCHADEKYGSRLPVHSSYRSRIFINDEKKGSAMRRERPLLVFKLFKTKADYGELWNDLKTFSKQPLKWLMNLMLMYAK